MINDGFHISFKEKLMWFYPCIFVKLFEKKNQSLPQGIPLDIPSLFLAKEQNTGKNSGHYSGTTHITNSNKCRVGCVRSLR